MNVQQTQFSQPASTEVTPTPLQVRNKKNNIRPHVTPEQITLSSEEIKASLALVRSLKSSVPVSGESITDSQRVNEQELYAALTYAYLSKTNSGAADRFGSGIETSLQQFEAQGSTNFYKAADRTMRALLRSKSISIREYRAARNFAFGKSQLDSNRRDLGNERAEDAASNDTPLRTVRTVLTAVEKNEPASAMEIAVFRDSLAKISRTKWREKRHAIGLAESSVSSRQTHSNIGAGFVWKPHSDSDGNLVIILPGPYTGQVAGLALRSPMGKVLTEGRYTGVANGGRMHFRFDRPGESFPPGTIVEIVLSDGRRQGLEIYSPGSRVEGS